MEQGEHGCCSNIIGVLVQDSLILLQGILHHVVPCIVLGQDMVECIFFRIEPYGCLYL